MSRSQQERPRRRGQTERISELLQRFIKHLRSHHRSERTIKSYCSDLKLFAKWFYETNRKELPPKSITLIDLKEYKRYLLEDRGFKPATVNRRLASISAFCKWAQEQGLAELSATWVKIGSAVEEASEAPRKPRELVCQGIQKLGRSSIPAPDTNLQP